MNAHLSFSDGEDRLAARDCVESTFFDPALLDVVPPFRFAMVEKGVYRGAYPTLRNFSFLSTLELRTIVLLTPEGATYDLSCFAAAENITLRYIRVGRYKGEVHLSPADMNEALQLLINADLHPLYIHCLDGRHVVGLVIMGLRKLQLWDVSCSHLEYQRFTRSAQDEVAFIADYSGPITLPKRIPEWLWKGSWCDAAGKPKRLNVGIRLKFPSLSCDAEHTESGRKGQLSGCEGENDLPGGGGGGAAGDALCAFVTSSSHPAHKARASPMHSVIVTSDGTGREVAYVDLLSIAPARLFETTDGLRQTACVIYSERPVTADVRFLSLRTSTAKTDRWGADSETNVSFIPVQSSVVAERSVQPYQQQVRNLVVEVAGRHPFTRVNSNKKTKRRKSL